MFATIIIIMIIITVHFPSFSNTILSVFYILGSDPGVWDTLVNKTVSPYPPQPSSARRQTVNLVTNGNDTLYAFRLGKYCPLSGAGAVGAPRAFSGIDHDLSLVVGLWVFVLLLCFISVTCILYTLNT